MRSWFLTTVPVLTLVGLTTLPAPARACEDTELVQSWCVRYLHRRGAPCELEAWAKHLRCGESPAALEAGFLATDEYFALHHNCPEEYIVALYADVLGRTPCRQEVATWMCQFRQACSRTVFTTKFLCAARKELGQQEGPGSGYDLPPARSPRQDYDLPPSYSPRGDYDLPPSSNPRPGYTPPPSYDPPVIQQSGYSYYRPAPPPGPEVRIRIRIGR
jgi:hypothetical protein